MVAAVPARSPPWPGAAVVVSRAPAAIDLTAAPPRTLATTPSAEELPASVADAFAGWALPAATSSPAPGIGAVDITAIAIPREQAPKPAVAVVKPTEKPAAAKPKAKPAKELHPARSWVQVATGKGLDALKFDWRRIARKADGKLDKIGPFTTPWVEANRLLAGPFPTPAAAKEMVKQLKSLGLDAFAYDSPAGEDITPLK